MKYYSTITYVDTQTGEIYDKATVERNKMHIKRIDKTYRKYEEFTRITITYEVKENRQTRLFD